MKSVLFVQRNTQGRFKASEAEIIVFGRAGEGVELTTLTDTTLL